MNKYTKLLSALLTAAMLCSLTGCRENNDSPFESSDVSQSSSENSEKSESSGAAHEGLNNELFTTTTSSTTTTTTTSSSTLNNSSVSVQHNESTQLEQIDVKMDEQLISLPCKVKDIKNITIDHGRNFSVKQRDNGTYMSSSLFEYNDATAGTIYLEGDCSGIADLSEVTVIGITVGDIRIPVSYMGLTLDSAKADIIRTLGDPVEEKDDYIYYYIEPEGSVTFSLNSEDKVSDIAVFLNIR